MSKATENRNNVPSREYIRTCEENRDVVNEIFKLLDELQKNINEIKEVIGV